MTHGCVVLEWRTCEDGRHEEERELRVTSTDFRVSVSDKEFRFNEFFRLSFCYIALDGRL